MKPAEQLDLQFPSVIVIGIEEKTLPFGGKCIISKAKINKIP